MKSLVKAVISIFILLVITSNTYGQKIWVGGNPGNLWSDANNWSPVGVPLISDDVIFNSTNNVNCNIDISATANSITISLGYTSTITQNTGIPIQINQDGSNSSFSQSDGIFIGSDSQIDCAGGISLTGGSFTSTSGDLNIGRGFEVAAAATFSHNSGTLIFDSNQNNGLISVDASETFYNLTISKAGNQDVEIDDGNTLVVVNALTLTRGEFDSDNENDPGFIQLQDASTMLTEGALFGGGTSILLIDHARTINLNTSGSFMGIQLDNAGASVNVSGLDYRIEGNLILNNGTFDDGGRQITFLEDFIIVSGTYTSSGGALFSGDTNTLDVNASVEFNDLEISLAANNRAITIASGDVVEVAGELTLTNGNINTGTIRPLASASLNNIDANFDGGTGLLEILEPLSITAQDGSSMFGITLNNAGATYNAPNTGSHIIEGDILLNNGTLNGDGTGAGNTALDINASLTISGGTFDASIGTTSFAGANFTYTSGTFNNNVGSFIIDTNGDMIMDLSSSISFNDLEISFNNNNQEVNIVDQNPEVDGTLTLTNGRVEAGEIIANGPLIHTATFDGAINGGTIRVASLGQSIELIDVGQFPGLILDASSTSTILSPISGGTTIEGVLTIEGGTFEMRDGNIVLNAAFTQSGGSFNVSGSGTFDDNNGTDFTKSAGSFTMPSQYFFSGDNFTHSGGTFSGGTGELILESGNGVNYNANTVLTFFDLTIDTGNNDDLTFLDQNLRTDGTLNLIDGRLEGGTIVANGPVTVSSTFDGAISDALIEIISTTGEVINLVDNAEFPGIILDVGSDATVQSPSGVGESSTIEGVLTINGGVFNMRDGDIVLPNNFTQTGGAFTASGSGTFDLTGTSFTKTDGAFTSPTVLRFTGSSFIHAALSGSNTFMGGGQLLLDGTLSVTMNLGSELTFNSVDISLTNTNDDLIITNERLRADALTLTGGRVSTGVVASNGNVDLNVGFSGAISNGRLAITSTNSSSIDWTGGGDIPGLLMETGNSAIISGPSSGNTLDIEGVFNLDAGTFNVGDGQINITASNNFTQTGGVFDGVALESGAALLDFNGDFTLSGGDFTSTANELDVAGSFAQLGGTFNGSTGLIDINDFSLSGGTFNSTTGLLDVGNVALQSNGIFNGVNGDILFRNTFSLTNGTFNGTLGAGTMTLSNTFTQDGGTFNGQSGIIDSNGNIALNGGTFTSTSGELQFAGTTWDILAVPAGNFDANNGTILFNRNGNMELNFGAEVTFFNTEVAITSNNDNLNINSSQIIISDGATLVLTDGEIQVGTIEVRGLITNNTNFAGGASGLLNITNGSGPRVITLTAATSELPPITLNDSDVTLNFPNVASETLTIEGALRVDDGTINTQASNLFIDGIMEFADGNFNGGSGDITVDGQYTQFGPAIFDGGTGAIQINGNFVLTAGSSIGMFTSAQAPGSLTITGSFTMTANQFDGSTGAIDINGDFSFLDSGSGSESFTSTSGNLNFGGANFTLVESNPPAQILFMANGGSFITDRNGGTTFNINDNLFLNDLEVALIGNNRNLSIGTGTSDRDIFEVANTLTLTNGIIRYGTIEANGQIVHSTTFDGGANGGTIEITASNSSTSTLAGGAFPSLIMNGTSATINGPASGTLDIENDFTLNAGNFALGAGNFEVDDEFLQTGGVFTGGDGDASVLDNLVQSGGIFNAGSGTFAVIDNMTINGTATFNHSDGSLVVGDNFSHSAGTFVGGSGLIDIGADFTLSSTANFTSTTGILEITDDFLNNTSSNFNANNGAVRFAGNPRSIINTNTSINNPETFHSIIINKTNNDVRTQVSLDLSGDFTVESRDLDLDNSNDNISIAGNFTNTSGADGIDDDGQAVTFDGASLQTITTNAAESFNNLIIDNSDAGILLANDFAVRNTLTMTDGDVDLNGNNIDLGTNGVVIGESDANRFMGSGGEILASGRDLSATSTSYTDIAGLGISITTGSGNTPGTTDIQRGVAEQDGNDDGMATNSITRYFDITPTTNTGLDLTLRIDYFPTELAESSSLQLESNLRMWRSTDTGVTWENVGGTVNEASDFVEVSGLDAFSRYTLSDVSNAALPIELLEFQASLIETEVEVTWQTVSETNNDFFTVERSLDGLQFESVVNVEGAGNSNEVRSYSFVDENPYLGRSFYRLKQTDFDGQFSYGPVKTIDNETVSISIYPNPVYEQMNISLLSPKIEDIYLVITDQLGSVITKLKYTSEAGVNIIPIKVLNYASGIYNLEIHRPELRQRSSRKFIVVK